MTEKNFLTKILTENALSRRSFLKWSAALGGTAVLAGGLTYGFKAVGEAAAAGQEQTLTVSCYHNCGGRCILEAVVSDGVVQRLVPDQDPVDTFESPRAIPCVRGRSNIHWVYSAERLKYPMKRVGKRGEGKFERITWDEALNTIATQMKRIKDTYGNEAFYYNYASGQIAGGIDNSYGGSGPLCRLMNLFGGYVNFYGSYSAACYSAVNQYIVNGGSNSVDDTINSKLVVLFADNPLVTRSGGKNDGYYLLKAKQAGAKFIVIDPRYSDSVAGLEAEWIPIFPGTDVALIAALANVMVKENMYDAAFVATHTVGFDESTLPDGAPVNSSWMAYIMGWGDGVEKTPEWAAPITGIPADRIVKLAREIAQTKPCSMLQGFGWNRRAYGEQPVRALPILAAMTGNFGVKGGGTGMRSSGGTSLPIGSFPVGKNPITATISCFMWPDFIERGSEMTSGPKDRIKGADQLSSNMKFMWNWAGNTIINQHADVNGTTKMLQDETKLEFLVVGDVMMTPSAKCADILLPETTSFEIDNIISGNGSGGANFAMFSHKLIEPLYETKDILWISEQLADLLGLGDQFRDGHNTREDWLHDIVAGAQAKDKNFPSYDDFKAAGVYKKVGGGGVIAFAGFHDDPVANPLTTATGKVEIYSPFLASQNNPDEIPAIPKYIPEWEGVSDPLRQKYPLLMTGFHFIGRSHSTFDNVDYLREAHVQSIWINSLDAKSRGIKGGDVVKVYNDRGEIHLPAFVTSRIRPGVTAVPQGAWHTPDANGVDVRGCINTLTKYQPTPFAKGNPQHTNLVQVEKV